MLAGSNYPCPSLLAATAWTGSVAAAVAKIFIVILRAVGASARAVRTILLAVVYGTMCAAGERVDGGGWW